jgi:FkbM family methyltransferase
MARARILAKFAFVTALVCFFFFVFAPDSNEPSSSEPLVRVYETASLREPVRSLRDSSAGMTELPEHHPFLPRTLFGRRVQVADFSRGHVDVALREIQEDGLYDLALNAILPREGEGKTVIDIGGNFGGFSMAVKIKAPKARLITFEAVPSNCVNLKANMETNGLANNWIFVCGAMGATDGDILYFSFNEEHSGAASSYKRIPGIHDGRRKFYDVMSNKLDTMLEKYNVDHVHALKIDCEGCEYDTLQTSKRIKDVDVVVAEFHMNPRLQSQGRSFENLKSFLRSQNPKIQIHTADVHMKENI